MGKPWTDGPRELIRHAVDHLGAGGDFDRRIAMISVDNAVELMAKVYLGLPKRARKGDGPSRKELDAASESFPDLLSLLESHASDRLHGIGLDDIEWYHRLRNQLYHSGNGITVEREKVETYLSLARSLFENLFEEQLELPRGTAQQTGVGQFMEVWIQLERLQRDSERRRRGNVAELQPDFPRRGDAWALARLDPALAKSYEAARRFRNELVHGLSAPDPDELRKQIEVLARVVSALSKK